MKREKGKLNLSSKDGKRCGENKFLSIASNVLERITIEGDSPVDVIIWSFSKSRASRIGSLNTAGLTANPKYKLKSDSVLVPRGKAEKYL